MIKCKWCPPFIKGRIVHPVTVAGKRILLCAEHREEHYEREGNKNHVERIRSNDRINTFVNNNAGVHGSRRYSGS